MVKKKICFSISSHNELVEIIKIHIFIKKVPIFFIKYYLINGFGIDWLLELKDMINKKFKKNKFEIFVDVKNDYGVFINLVEKKIKYIKVKANQDTLKRLKQIAKINKVLINPNFSVVDISKYKNKLLKIKNLYKNI